MALNLYSLILVAFFAVLLATHPSEAHSRKLIKSARKTSFSSLDEVRRYLETYGYMEVTEHPNGATGDTLTTELSLEPAIRLYQKRNHLKVTGTMDSETVAKMMTPRCGMPDIDAKKPVKKDESSKQSGNKFQVVADYTFNGGVWTKTQLTYTITSTIESVSMAELRAICNRALQRWAAVTPLQFQEAGEGEEADIKIGFYSGDHGDGYPFDGPGNVLAHAFRPTDGRLHYDGTEQWSTTTPTTDQFDLESVMVHELGHSLGLGHSSDPSAVMYPSISPGATKRELQQDDIDGIQARYASK